MQGIYQGHQIGTGGLMATELSNRLDQKVERRLDVLVAQADGIRNVVGRMGARVADLRIRLTGTRPPSLDPQTVPGVSGAVPDSPLDEIASILAETSRFLGEMCDDIDALETL